MRDYLNLIQKLVKARGRVTEASDHKAQQIIKIKVNRKMANFCKDEKNKLMHSSQLYSLTVVSTNFLCEAGLEDCRK
jgi:hypothetical protein